MNGLIFGIMVIIGALGLAGWTAAIVSCVLFELEGLTFLFVVGWIFHLAALCAFALWMGDAEVKS